jgi:hypothetical protein
MNSILGLFILIKKKSWEEFMKLEFITEEIVQK